MDKDKDQIKKTKLNPELKKLGMLETWIVGIQYYFGPIEKDIEIYFQRNPANEYDANAIEAYASGDRQIRGYLPRYDAEYFGSMIDSGAIYIRGLAGEKHEATRQAVRLEIFATSKASPLLQPNNADDPRAIYHNFILNAFLGMDKLSPATLFTVREWFRPIAHDCDLFPETKLIYRIMKYRINELRKDTAEKEWKEFLDLYEKNPDFKGRLALLQKRKHEIVY